jgi:hypothetical protein
VRHPAGVAEAPGHVHQGAQTERSGHGNEPHRQRHGQRVEPAGTKGAEEARSSYRGHPDQHGYGVGVDRHRQQQRRSDPAAVAEPGPGEQPERHQAAERRGLVLGALEHEQDELGVGKAEDEQEDPRPDPAPSRRRVETGDPHAGQDQPDRQRRRDGVDQHQPNTPDETPHPQQEEVEEPPAVDREQPAPQEEVAPHHLPPGQQGDGIVGTSEARVPRHGREENGPADGGDQPGEGPGEPAQRRGLEHAGEPGTAGRPGYGWSESQPAVNCQV